MREKAISEGRAGLMGPARDCAEAMVALDAATVCSRCSTPKRQGADWRASINRTRVRGMERRSIVVLCGSCSRSDDARRRGFKSPADRRARLEDAERLTATAPHWRGTTSRAARLARLEQAERNVAAWRRPAR
jgi:hypothetical protein